MTIAKVAGFVLGLGTVGVATLDEIPLGLPAELAEGRAPVEVEVLGETLFFDKTLSSDRTVSCATCHDPGHGFADDEPFSEGVGGQRTIRNTPTILNRALGETFSWDGSKATLEEQVLAPIANELEMALPLSQAVARLSESELYVDRFREVLGGPPTEERIAAALAAFVRSKLVGNSPVDRFRKGDADALSTAERGGLWFFESRGS